MDIQSRLLHWHQTLASIYTQQSADAIADLLRGLEGLADGCNSMAIIYAKGGPPTITHHRLLANEDPKLQLDSYTDGAYLLDPFYRKSVDDPEEGVYTLKQVSPDGFEKSEYFNLYYRQSKLKDEVCFIFTIQNDMTASISIGRSETLNTERFSIEELALLRSTLPLVKALYAELIEADKHATPSLKTHLDQALKNFGSSLLTPKECEILQLILQGNSVKAVAEKLSNSEETIKHHRKKIYTKLDVSSQAELFHLLISSLRHISGSNLDIDPLQAYCASY